MTAITHTARDSRTMLRRNIRHMIRYPSLTVMLVAMPAVFLLLFVFVFGGTLGAGLGNPAGGRADYLAYIVPGILVMAIAGAAAGTSIAVAMDMTEGIIARFRTMAISRAAVLTGHVIGSMIQMMICLVVIVAIAILIGYRPPAGILGWLGALGMLGLVGFAITWLSVGLGMYAKSVETASNLPMPLLLLSFFSSGFVPTDSMPAALAWFADNQPFTAFIETTRSLLMGTPVGSSALVSVGWCLAISVVGYLWSVSLYERRSVR